MPYWLQLDAILVPGSRLPQGGGGGICLNMCRFGSNSMPSWVQDPTYHRGEGGSLVHPVPFLAPTRGPSYHRAQLTTGGLGGGVWIKLCHLGVILPWRRGTHTHLGRARGALENFTVTTTLRDSHSCSCFPHGCHYFPSLCTLSFIVYSWICCLASPGRKRAQLCY